MEPLNRGCMRTKQRTAAKELDRLALSEQLRNERVSKGNAGSTGPTSWSEPKASDMPKLKDDLQEDVANVKLASCEDVIDVKLDRQLGYASGARNDRRPEGRAALARCRDR